MARGNLAVPVDFNQPMTILEWKRRLFQVENHYTEKVMFRVTDALGPEVMSGIPVVATVPVITGTAQVGQTLTASTGVFYGAPTSYAYAWYADGVVIALATASTYVPVIGQIDAVITVKVTATNHYGASSAAASAATSAVIAA